MREREEEKERKTEIGKEREKDREKGGEKLNKYVATPVCSILRASIT